MTRGVCTDEAKGAKRVQKLRPTCFTADWTDGVLVQARLRGPRVLQDGSLGERDLDHRRKRTRATGPVKYSDLPSSVASRLCSYKTENGFKVLPEQL
jgi:exodeoxyribonuclease-3